MLKLKTLRGWFLFFAGIFAVGCTGKKGTEHTIIFDRNLTETKEPEFVCRLSEDSILLAPIRDFAFLNNDSFVVADGRGAYLYDISGVFKKQFGHTGRASGEMMSPSSVYVTSDRVYIWCSSLLKMLIFDHEAHFMTELSGFERAVKKFVVDPNNERIYLYTSGHVDDTRKKAIDVISIYDMAEKSILKSFEERVLGDELMSSLNNSGGLCIDNDQFIYIHPGSLAIHEFDLSSEEVVSHKIEDRSFRVEEISNLDEITGNFNKWRDYIRENSVVKGLDRDRRQYVIVSEIGSFGEPDSDSEILGDRKTKLYLLNSSFRPDRTILYDYINSPDIEIRSDALYFLITDIDSDDQVITLNRYPLLQ
jgi:hypothetical protein